MSNLESSPLEFRVDTGLDSRLRVRMWTVPNEPDFLAILPEHRDRSGEWCLTEPGLVMTRDVAHGLAAALELAVTALKGAEEIVKSERET